MGSLIGIRRENKNQWERRVPLIPADLSDLEHRHGLRFLVQHSSNRIYTDDEYASLGIEVNEDLSRSSIIFAVKEVPIHRIQAGKVYIFFAHVAKGQPHNMAMLKRLMDLGCSLVDYEKVTDDQKKRLIFFGRHAGYAGMIETLYALGRRLAHLGCPTPFMEIRHAYEYPDLTAAKKHLEDLRKTIALTGLPDRVRRLVVGISGYGNVSAGAQEVFDCLQPLHLAVADLPSAMSLPPTPANRLIKVVFREEDMVRHNDPGKAFNLLEYYEHPERFSGCFEKHLPHLDVLVNAIYWERCYPRLVTRQWARRTYLPGSAPRLRVIGDISCDIEGSIELTVRATQPDNACYVYLPQEDAVRDGFEGDGPVIMAIDNLPCEMPRESSHYFSSVLRDMVPALAATDWQMPFERLDLASHLKRAVIVHKGELTPAYRYLHKHLAAAPRAAEGS